MSGSFWQAKLFGLLNTPTLKALHLDRGIDPEDAWKGLQCMESGPLSDLSDLSEPVEPSYSGHTSDEISLIPIEILRCLDARKVFWWFWRCYPQLLAYQRSDRSSGELIEQDSVWSQASVAAALAGATAGYSLASGDTSDDDNNDGQDANPSRPHISLFTFTPVQEFIQASRTMQDVWAGSWLLHYLTAKVCWEIAWKYGPDTLLYPCLYAQPLIDFWLLHQYPDFEKWVPFPSDKAKTQAGFPNDLIMILPDNGSDPKATKGNPIRATMIRTEQVFKQEWLALGRRVLSRLRKKHSDWQSINLRLWDSWLESQWQSYWVSAPIDMSQSSTGGDRLFNLTTFSSQEQGQEQGQSLEQARHNLNAVKYARTWKFPTVFGLRSTISGIGPVVRPDSASESSEWATERQTHEFWKNQPPLFDGLEELNATEVVKRGLYQILPDILDLKTESTVSDLPFSSNSVTDWSVFAAGDGDGMMNGLQGNGAELETHATFYRTQLDLSHHLFPYLTEQRYAGQLIYGSGDDVLASLTLQDWADWLWDIRQCFKGADDPEIERQFAKPASRWPPQHPEQSHHFQQGSGYWQWQGQEGAIASRPFATMGTDATISFGLVIAPLGVPLPLVLENLWQAKAGAKQHQSPHQDHKDAVQVRVLYGNGHALTATAKFEVFHQWQQLLNVQADVKPSLFEQASYCWKPSSDTQAESITKWAITFCDRYQDSLNTVQIEVFQAALIQWLQGLCQTTLAEDCDREIQNWLHLAAFIHRHAKSGANPLNLRSLSKRIAP